ncbi:uncharacterized protein VICG_01672 [Vittaforma corneae ATCC 50505]|uniref:Uncharacterized protein n=1 Tax=Vittaforma corneae (strain ATCC 50505) TaxID=993615 RepID=L2GKY7_VITCO|nr:uncharacterized protein VICG_01672 [Vittaforma corneae ATCC 50505]ELA41299.1 hypothetical protein VICG_01672 [Vittaforma corneae ATCC 50505]
MVFKETFETIHETEKEVQKCLTYLKEHAYNGREMLNASKYIKSYKEELGIQSRLKFLADFLEDEKKQAEKELKTFKQGVATECLNVKCKQIENKIQSDFAIEDDYGEED